VKRLLLGLLFFASCFPSEGPRQYPTWERTTQGIQVLADCAEADAWVSKSGKEGMGVTLQLAGRSTTPCVVTIKSARLRLGNEEYAAHALPEPPMLQLGQHVLAYLPFSFDGDRAWNDKVEGDLVIEGANRTVSFHLRQTLPSREECESR
jgi:hypothetical protein